MIMEQVFELFRLFFLLDETFGEQFKIKFGL
jgi:hypothetical protein